MAKRARVTIATEPVTIVCFGDSNTFGQSADSDERLPYLDRWTTHLARLLGANANIIPEGLNGRTTVHDDPIDAAFVGVGGDNLNGRRYLLPCLHSHKPVDVVVLALGCNDLKTRFSLNADEVCRGLQLLVADVRQSGAGPGGGAPKITVVSPPACNETADNKQWGFAGCAAKSRAVIEAYRDYCAVDGLDFVDLSQAAPVGSDGIHFSAKASLPIAKAVAKKVVRRLSPQIQRSLNPPSLLEKAVEAMLDV